MQKLTKLRLIPQLSADLNASVKFLTYNIQKTFSMVGGVEVNFKINLSICPSLINNSQNISSRYNKISEYLV